MQEGAPQNRAKTGKIGPSWASQYQTRLGESLSILRARSALPKKPRSSARQTLRSCVSSPGWFRPDTLGSLTGKNFGGLPRLLRGTCKALPPARCGHAVCSKTCKIKPNIIQKIVQLNFLLKKSARQPFCSADPARWPSSHLLSTYASMAELKKFLTHE